MLIIIHNSDHCYHPIRLDSSDYLQQTVHPVLLRERV